MGADHPHDVQVSSILNIAFHVKSLLAMIFGMWCAESWVSVITSSWQLSAGYRDMLQAFCCRKLH